MAVTTLEESGSRIIGQGSEMTDSPSDNKQGIQFFVAPVLLWWNMTFAQKYSLAVKILRVSGKLFSPISVADESEIHSQGPTFNTMVTKYFDEKGHVAFWAPKGVEGCEILKYLWLARNLRNGLGPATSTQDAAYPIREKLQKSSFTVYSIAN